MNGRLRKRDDGWEIRSSGLWREKNWCILKSLAVIIVGVGICSCRESSELASWLLCGTSPLPELSEPLEPTALVCDDEADSPDGAEILLGGCEAHFTPVWLLSVGGSGLGEVELVGLAVTTGAFGGLAELKKRPPPDLDEK